MPVVVGEGIPMVAGAGAARKGKGEDKGKGYQLRIERLEQLEESGILLVNYGVVYEEAETESKE